MTTIYIDADGCPEKDETYRVAKRHGLKVVVVANQHQRTPLSPLVSLTVVGSGFNAADDWIAERAGQGDVVVTADVPLAARCVAAGARVVGPKGREFSEASVGDALAARNLADHLREMGVMTGGPAPMGDRDRSRFLNELERVVQAAKREAAAD